MRLVGAVPVGAVIVGTPSTIVMTGSPAGGVTGVPVADVGTSCAPMMSNTKMIQVP